MNIFKLQKVVGFKGGKLDPFMYGWVDLGSVLYVMGQTCKIEKISLKGNGSKWFRGVKQVEIAQNVFINA